MAMSVTMTTPLKGFKFTIFFGEGAREDCSLATGTPTSIDVWIAAAGLSQIPVLLKTYGFINIFLQL